MVKGSGRIPTCHPERKHGGHGLCRKCYLAKWHKESNPTDRPYGTIPTCHPERPHKARGLCLQCYQLQPDRSAKDAAYRAANSRRDRLKHRYGITIEQYNALNEQQHGLCAICKRPPRGKTKRLSVDHSHTTGKVRGLLCVTCNRSLGYMENTAWFAAATTYLDSHK